MNKESNNMTLVSTIDDKKVVNTLEQICKPLEQFVLANNLPTENVLASNEENVRLFNNFNKIYCCWCSRLV